VTILRELVAAEGLLARIHRLVIAQHGHLHDVGADVDDRDVLVLRAPRQPVHHQGQRGLLRKRFHVHHQRRQPREVGHRDAVLDALLARRGDHHFLFVGVGGRRPDRLEIEVDFLESKRDVLVRFAFHLHLEILLPQRRRDRDLLGDHRARGYRHRDVLDASAEALVGALHCVRGSLEVVDVAIDHRVARERFDGVALDAVGILASLRDLEHLHRGRADVEPEQRRRLWLEQVKCHI